MYYHPGWSLSPRLVAALGARAAPRSALSRRFLGLLVRVRLGGVDRGGQVAGGDAPGLLALRPVELLVDLLLRVAAGEERLFGAEDHVGVAADVSDRVGRREAQLVEDRLQDRLDPSGPADPGRIDRIVRARDGGNVRDRVLARLLPALHDVAVAELVGMRNAVEEHGPARRSIGQHLAHHRNKRGIARAR